ncbi:MAG: ShET2 enterotoxin, N-terminal region [Herminiimonas sp.]|nr:ShET2 enterotoxin, N-terminal region [Herminiimonas sp.]
MKPDSVARRDKFASSRSIATAAPSGRSSRMKSSETSCPPSGIEDVCSHFLRPSLSAASLASRRDVLNVIEQAMRHGDTHLDFNHVDPAALKAVPGVALKALARQVSGVMLPAGLDALPRCLNRLKGLRSIEMDGCMARQIDVTPWNLDRLTITGRTELRWIHANQGTAVNCPAPGIRRKVCVNVYRDGKLLGRTAAGSQRYIKTPARRAYDINGVFTTRNGQIALCRPITAWWLGERAERHADKRNGAIDPASDMYAVLRNRRSFGRAVSDDMQSQHDEALANATRNIMVGDDRFGEVIEKEFRRMRRGGMPAQKLFQANSVSHAMGLELKVKNGLNGKPEYLLVFYDANMSATHVRIKFHHPGEALDLRFTGLFANKIFAPGYFGDEPAVVTLVDLDSVQPGGKRSLNLMLTEREKRTAKTLNLVIQDGFNIAAEELIGDLRIMTKGEVDWNAILLTLSGAKATPLFIVLQVAERPRLARVLADLVTSLVAEGAVGRTTLFQMLQQNALEDKVGFTALVLACYADDGVFITQLIDLLVQPKADGLATAAEYESLLANGGATLPPPYAYAIQLGHTGAALSMVQGMLRLTDANRITRHQFVRLLACRDGQGIPAIEKAFEEGNAALMRALMEPLTSAATVAFSTTQLIAMLTAARADGTPALRATYQAGHAEFLAAYGELVLSAVSRDRISAPDAIALLTAAAPTETPCDALRGLAPDGKMLRTLGGLLTDARLARWLPDDLSEALEELIDADLVSSFSDFESES